MTVVTNKPASDILASTCVHPCPGPRGLSHLPHIMVLPGSPAGWVLWAAAPSAWAPRPSHPTEILQPSPPSPPLRSTYPSAPGRGGLGLHVPSSDAPYSSACTHTCQLGDHTCQLLPAPRQPHHWRQPSCPAHSRCSINAREHVEVPRLQGFKPKPLEWRVHRYTGARVSADRVVPEHPPRAAGRPALPGTVRLLSVALQARPPEQEGATVLFHF